MIRYQVLANFRRRPRLVAGCRPKIREVEDALCLQVNVKVRRFIASVTPLLGKIRFLPECSGLPHIIRKNVEFRLFCDAGSGDS